MGRGAVCRKLQLQCKDKMISPVQRAKVKASDIAQSPGAKLAKLAESAVNLRNSCADKPTPVQIKCNKLSE